MKKLKTMHRTIQRMLKERKYQLGVTGAAIGIIFLFILMPVLFTPGNSFLFQLTLFTIKEYLLLAALALIASININLQIYAYKQAKVKTGKHSAASSLSAFLAAFFGTASCAGCLTTILGFLGFGTMLVLLKYRWLITAGTLIIMLLSLYFTTQKIERGCKSCSDKKW